VVQGSLLAKQDGQQANHRGVGGAGGLAFWILILIWTATAAFLWRIVLVVTNQISAQILTLFHQLSIFLAKRLHRHIMISHFVELHQQVSSHVDPPKAHPVFLVPTNHNAVPTPTLCCHAIKCWHRDASRACHWRLLFHCT
jgi:hypothetical protein